MVIFCEKEDTEINKMIRLNKYFTVLRLVVLVIAILSLKNEVVTGYYCIGDENTMNGGLLRLTEWTTTLKKVKRVAISHPPAHRLIVSLPDELPLLLLSGQIPED